MLPIKRLILSYIRPQVRAKLEDHVVGDRPAVLLGGTTLLGADAAVEVFFAPRA